MVFIACYGLENNIGTYVITKTPGVWRCRKGQAQDRGRGIVNPAEICTVVLTIYSLVIKRVLRSYDLGGGGSKYDFHSPTRDVVIFQSKTVYGRIKINKTILSNILKCTLSV